MKTLFKLVMSQIIKDLGMFIGGSLVAILLLQQFSKTGYEMYTLVFLAAGIMHVMGIGRITRNQSWLLILPVKRSKIILLHYLVATASFILYALSTILVLLLSALFNSAFKEVVSFQALMGILKTLFSAEQAMHVIQGFKTASLEDWSLLLVLFGLFNLFFMGPYNFPKLQKAFRNLWNHADSRWRLFYRSVFLGLCCIPLFGAFSFSSDIEILIACSITFVFGAAALASYSVAMPHRTQKRFLTAYGVLALAPIALIYTVALQKTTKTSADGKPTKQQIEAYSFLGPLGPKPSAAVLTELLEHNLSDDEFSKALKGLGIDRIRKSTHPQIQFSRVLTSKKFKSNVFELVDRYFDVRDLDLVDVKTTLNYFEGHPSYTKAFYWLVPANLTTAEISSLLMSGIPSYIEYALTKSRFERRPELVSTIESNLNGFPDKSKFSALQTLTFLTGRSTSLNTWVEQKSGRAPASTFLSVDCQGYDPQSEKQWTREEIATFNLCLHERAYAKGSQTILRVDQAGWLAPPFSQAVQKLTTQIFRR